MRSGVIFDLDGTLIDSAQTILSILNGIRAMREHDSISMADVRPHLSKGGRALVQAALQRAATDPDDDLLLFRDHYARAPQGPEIVFHAVEATLQRLSDAGYPLAICSNKPEPLARSALQLTDLARFFEVVVCAGQDTPAKPNPAAVLECCRRLGVVPEQAVLIGDSEADAVAAERAGVRFVLVEYGYPVGDPGAIACDHRVACASELPEILELLPLAAPARRSA